MTQPLSTQPLDAHPLGEDRLAELVAAGSPYVHIITIATKPDIIKQAPVHAELVRRGAQVLVCHTGQHHDHRYSGAMLEEFGLTPDVYLGIDGTPQQKVAQIIERFSELLDTLVEADLTPIPYIHGDTMTSMAVGVGSYLHRVACVHVEAGIRTLTPKRAVYEQFLSDFRAGEFDWSAYAKAMREESTFERGSREPYPEQFNTRVSDVGTGFHAAPVEVDRQFLVDEGFPPDTIEVVGNSVADATLAAKEEAAKATIFQRYPQLRDGRFIRICIHRRENTHDWDRFTVLIDAMETLLRRGHSVLLISLFGTEEAIDRFDLRSRMDGLAAEFPETFIYSDVWPNYRDVIAAMLQCSVVATDSGSMQEEMNVLGVPCVTLRFGTDRGESVLAGSNVLAPPIDSDFVVTVIERAMGNPDMAGVGNIYGRDVAQRLVDEVLRRLRPGDGLFRSEEQRLASS